MSDAAKQGDRRRPRGRDSARGRRYPRRAIEGGRLMPWYGWLLLVVIVLLVLSVFASPSSRGPYGR